MLVGEWFETVAAAQRRAERRLPRSVYSALVAGTERGLTMADNVAAFDEVGVAPHVAGHSAKRDLATTVMGQSLSMPVVLSPTGVQAVHPDGEVAVARAGASRGVAMGLSSFASRGVEEVAAATAQMFFQVYWAGDRDAIAARVERARAAGAKGLILTLDWSFSHGRDWGSPWIPQRMDLRAMLRSAPEALARPAWLWSFVRTGHIPTLLTPNMAVDGHTPTFFEAYAEWMGTPPPSWEDVAWLAALWGGPFMVKGVGRADDARRCVDAGASALSVSNHGGNNLDSTPGALRLLPSVAAAVGGEVEVLLDGGVRRGADVAKALALGARAVMIGRAYLWGLAANGQVGVENVLDVLRGGLDSALLALGRSSVAELGPDDVIVPAGFARAPGP
ncbi:MAG: pre-mycofactocin synthase MftD [Acidimicrobiales bacterium]